MASSIKIINGGLTYYSFYDSDKPNYIFANYWSQAQPLSVKGIAYKTPEHYFQSLKFPVGSPEHAAILNARSANDARREAGRLFQDPAAKSRWYGGGDYNAMLDVVRERLKQDPDFKKELMATGTGYILEDTYKGPPSGGPADSKWGGGANGLGQNLLGMALMEVRNEEFQRLNKLDMVVDPKRLRSQAQAERQQINSIIQGGANATDGKVLSEIHQLYMSQAPQPKPDISPVAPALTLATDSFDKDAINKRINFLSDESLEKIKKACGNHWTVTKDASGKFADAVHKVDKDKGFKIESAKLSTTHNNAETFVTMIQAFLAVHPDKKMTMSVDSAAKATLEAACRQLKLDADKYKIIEKAGPTPPAPAPTPTVKR